jgi:hypothetical protein
MTNDAARARANSIFKKEQQAREGEVAWKEYEDKQAAARTNMQRLRALRLARDGKTTVIRPPSAPPTAKQARRVYTGPRP